MRRAAWSPNDRGVSPVIGVILLVGISVMLMAAIGLFVLGIGPGEQTPRGEVLFEQHGENDEKNVTITVADGTGLFADDLTLSVDGTDAVADGCVKDGDTWSGGLDAGDRITVTGSDDGSGDCDGLESEQVVQVIWQADAGGRSEILAQWEVF